MKKTFVAPLLVLMASVWLLLPSHGARAGLRVGADVFECGRVGAIFGECFTYLSGMATHPLPSCCEGAEQLVKMASEPEDNQFGCKCFKEAVAKFHNIRKSALMDLSKECHVELYLYSGDDCNK